MKLSELIKTIKNVPINVSFIPEGIIKFNDNNKKIHEYEHSTELLAHINHGGLYGFHYLSGYKISIIKKNSLNSRIASFIFESIDDITQDLQDMEIKKIISIDITVRTNTTGSISYSQTNIELEV